MFWNREREREKKKNYRSLKSISTPSCGRCLFRPRTAERKRKFPISLLAAICILFRSSFRTNFIWFEVIKSGWVTSFLCVALSETIKRNIMKIKMHFSPLKFICDNSQMTNLYIFSTFFCLSTDAPVFCLLACAVSATVVFTVYFRFFSLFRIQIANFISIEFLFLLSRFGTQYEWRNCKRKFKSWTRSLLVCKSKWSASIIASM